MMMMMMMMVILIQAMYGDLALMTRERHSQQLAHPFKGRGGFVAGFPAQLAQPSFTLSPAAQAFVAWSSSELLQPWRHPPNQSQ
jgi:hypothetical protein